MDMKGEREREIESQTSHLLDWPTTGMINSHSGGWISVDSARLSVWPIA